MSRNTLIGLAIAAVVAVLAAAWLQHDRAPQSAAQADASDWLLPALHGHVNEVDKVVVSGAGDAVLVTLERGKAGWSVAQKGGYAADTGKLRALLLALADARAVERKTASKDKYAVLGVEDLASSDAKGVAVTLEGLAQPVKLIIGQAAPRGEGTYVRRAGEDASWLASANLHVAKAPADWLGKALVDIPAERIEAVTLTPLEGPPVRIAKASADETHYTLQDIPKGREAASAYTVDGLAGALAGLQFDDVLAADAAEPPEATLAARYETFDGVVVEARAWQHEGKDYARFSATLDASRADAAIDAAQAQAKAAFEAARAKAATDAASANGAPADAAPADAAPAEPLAVSDPARDRAERLAAVEKEVADLQARFSGWTFVLPAWKYANLDKSLEALLKPKDDKSGG